MNDVGGLPLATTTSSPAIDPDQTLAGGTSAPATPLQRAAAYFDETIDDYRLWSPRLNLHFGGVWKPGMSLLDREAMLERMNSEVFDRLGLDRLESPRLLDMGCGAGTAARALLRVEPSCAVVGITASPAHARLAGRPAADEARRPSIVVGDYCSNPFPDRSFDGVYCIESACYAPGLSKAELLAEIARLIVPGGRMVVADPFLRAAPPRFPLSRVAHDWLCESVALETLGHLDSFVAAAEAAGFEDIAVDDVTANVLPALLHGPAVMIRWVARVAREGASRVAPWRWRNAVGALPLAVLVCDPTAFGYFIVSARRGGSR